MTGFSGASAGRYYALLRRRAAPTQATRYYLSHQPVVTAADALTAVRGQWAVENHLHWHLDVTLGQDAHRLRDLQAAENLVLVRKMAMTMLHTDPGKGSLKPKCKCLGWRDACLEGWLKQIVKCGWSAPPNL